MVQHLPEPYRIDPVDPRAPSQEVWDAMTPEQRARVVAMLPAEVPSEAEERAQAEGERAQTEATRATVLEQELAEVKQKLTAAEALIADLKRDR